MSNLIDREQAIKLLNLNKPNVDEKTKYAMWQFDKDLNTIKTMPSSEKVGKWLPAQDYTNGNEDIECSNCGEWFKSLELCGRMGEPNYCPVCGAKME